MRCWGRMRLVMVRRGRRILLMVVRRGGCWVMVGLGMTVR